MTRLRLAMMGTPDFAVPTQVIGLALPPDGLAAALADKSAAVRAHAALALGNLGDEAKPVVAALASMQFDDSVNRTLEAILGTEISPELVPGAELQSTESQIGPYALHDFTLFHLLRYGLRPTKIGFLACHAWEDAGAGEWPPNFPDAERVAYSEAEIRGWLEVFCRRFFGFAQFKRSALPNGPKVSHGGSLSPRGDWRAPSDSTADAWLRDLERWDPAAT